MEVEVRLFASLREYLPGVKTGEGTRLALPEGATVADLFAALAVPAEEVRQTFVNGRVVEPQRVLQEGDRVGIFPPVGGGSGEVPDTSAILAIDVGAGTQDILLYREGIPIENCVQLILPSPTVILAGKVAEATSRGRPLFLVGHVMGGGAVSGAVRAHLEAGLDVYATPAAAATLYDDPARVRAMGVKIVDSQPAGTESVTMRDVDLPALGAALAPFGVALPATVAVAVQDHGYAPHMSNRLFRFEHWRRFVAEGGDIKNLIYAEPPSYLTRMRAVREDVPGAYVMDTGAAAIWGALADEEVAGHRDEGLTVVNVGNAHTVVALLRGSRVEGLLEHHTGALTSAKLADYVSRLRRGEVREGEVFDDGGHGSCYAPSFQPSEGFAYVAVTGPNRGLAANLGYHFAVPYGDMMLAGCFGLVAALRAKVG
ncbi:MAG: DUF1786 family protein [Dehalococcoidales bacterium]|nr:DUF1786 family protein [Dehalococcoidales bacterium]